MSSLFQPALAAALGAVVAVAMAQPAPPGRATAAAPAAVPASAPVTGYRSVFEGYRPFTEQQVGSWRGANDVVGRIGGWQAYAREGQGGPVAGSSSSPAASGPMFGHKMP